MNVESLMQKYLVPEERAKAYIDSVEFASKTVREEDPEDSLRLLDAAQIIHSNSLDYNVKEHLQSQNPELWISVIPAISTVYNSTGSKKILGFDYEEFFEHYKENHDIVQNFLGTISGTKNKKLIQINGETYSYNDFKNSEILNHIGLESYDASKEKVKSLNEEFDMRSKRAKNRLTEKRASFAKRQNLLSPLLFFEAQNSGRIEDPQYQIRLAANEVEKFGKGYLVTKQIFNEYLMNPWSLLRPNGAVCDVNGLEGIPKREYLANIAHFLDIHKEALIDEFGR